MGKTTALTPQQKRGLELFLTKGNCVSCHHGPFLTSQDYMPTNLQGDEGRAKVTKNLSDKGLFRIPTLRNVGLTGPYFHNGAVTSLDEAVFLRANNMRLQEYKGKGTPDPSSLVLNETEVKDVAAFLKALNGKMPAIFEPKQFPQ